MNKSFII